VPFQLYSAENWRFAAKHFIKKHPEDVAVHCKLNSMQAVLYSIPKDCSTSILAPFCSFILFHSAKSEFLLGGSGSGCNTAARTFDGIDVMGRRLAEEVSIDELILKESQVMNLIKNECTIICIDGYFLPFSFIINNVIQYRHQILLFSSTCLLNLLLLLRVVKVTAVVESRPELRKISFVAHSLGGLIARYAIALLYERETQKDPHEECEKHVIDYHSNQHSSGGKIAGLEPINFITFATPHLGTRSHKQVTLKLLILGLIMNFFLRTLLVFMKLLMTPVAFIGYIISSFQKKRYIVSTFYAGDVIN
jgi:hypothetical protein